MYVKLLIPLIPPLSEISMCYLTFVVFFLLKLSQYFVHSIIKCNKRVVHSNELHKCKGLISSHGGGLKLSLLLCEWRYTDQKIDQAFVKFSLVDFEIDAVIYCAPTFI